MVKGYFWLNDRQWEKIEPLLPPSVKGKRRVDDRRVLSGIIQVLKSGCRWSDSPLEYGPRKTLYNRFVRWAIKGRWEELFMVLALRVIADAAYDYEALRLWLAGRGSRIIIPNRKNRKTLFPFDAVTYKRRNVVERTFCRLKVFRRLATRYDRLDETFLATLCIAAALAYFLK